MNRQLSRSFHLDLPRNIFPAPDGIGPPHFVLIKDKLSRLKNRFKTEMICAVRTLGGVVSVGWGRLGGKIW